MGFQSPTEPLTARRRCDHPRPGRPCDPPTEETRHRFSPI